MKAGQSQDEVGTRVRIVSVTDEDDADLVGRTGELTHPFPGLMSPGVSYSVGVWLDGRSLRRDITNLCPGDRYEVIS